MYTDCEPPSDVEDCLSEGSGAILFDSEALALAVLEPQGDVDNEGSSSKCCGKSNCFAKFIEMDAAESLDWLKGSSS